MIGETQESRLNVPSGSIPTPPQFGGDRIPATVEIVSGGSIAEAAGGLGAVVLAILALANILPIWLAPIAAIVLGGALFLQGGAMATRFHSLLAKTSPAHVSSVQFGSGMGAEILGGIAGVVLGILALLHIVPVTLLTVCAIVFGAALLMASGSNARLNAIRFRDPSVESYDWIHHVTAEILAAADGVQVLVGLGAIVLGIIALDTARPLTLDLISFLAVGGSVLLSGPAVAARMVAAWNRPH